MDCLHVANGVISVAGVFVLSWVVLHPQLHEGVIIKTGLIAMIFSLAATAYHTLNGSENWQALWAAGFLLRVGLAVAGIGILVRAGGIGFVRGKHRRAADWTLPEERKESGHVR